MIITPRARRVGEAAHVLDDALRTRVRRRARGCESAALYDDVVLHVLDDHGAAPGIQSEALRRGSRALRAARRRRPACVDIGLVARADLGRDRVDRMGRGHEQGAKVLAAPGEVRDLLGYAQLAD